MSRPESARDWLRRNGYDDVADMIEEIMKEWKRSGKGTCRNWWKVLAGGKDGRPSVIYGRTFPVLRVAQRRFGGPVTKNAISRAKGESAPRVESQERWTSQRDG